MPGGGIPLRDSASDVPCEGASLPGPSTSAPNFTWHYPLARIFSLHPAVYPWRGDQTLLAATATVQPVPGLPSYTAHSLGGNVNTPQKALRRIAAATVAAAIGAAMVLNIAAAQSPPSPPSRFVGVVTLNGQPATPGTVVEARIGGVSCGATTVFSANGQSRYTLDSPALDPALSPGCGTDGATVTFFVAGQQAAETGAWRNYQLNTVDLTANAATPVPATPTAQPTTPATPQPPVAGTGAAQASDGAPSLLELSLVAAALGLGGVALAARSRRA